MSLTFPYKIQDCTAHLNVSHDESFLVFLVLSVLVVSRFVFLQPMTGADLTVSGRPNPVASCMVRAFSSDIGVIKRLSEMSCSHLARACRIRSLVSDFDLIKL